MIWVKGEMSRRGDVQGEISKTLSWLSVGSVRVH